MQHAIKKESYDLLKLLVSKTMESYNSLLDSQKQEYVDYPYMNYSQLNDLINILNDATDNLCTDIILDIIEINKNKAVLGNINYILNLKIHEKLYCLDDDEFNRVLIESLKQQFFLKEIIEKRIREVFFNLILDDISNMDDKLIKNMIASLALNIIFKYGIDKEEERMRKKSSKDLIDLKLPHYKIEYFNQQYLDSAIWRIIDILLSYKDEDFMSDKTYVIATTLSILLRSIFVIIDDYKALVPYEEYYNEKEKRDTKAKNFIRNAFIMHYEDMQNDSLKRLSKS